MTALEKKLLKNLRGALLDFEMIKPGETVLLGVSGGKDSMVLGYLLNEYRKQAKDKFEIRGIYIFKEFLIDCDINFEEKRKYFEEVLNIPLEKVNINLPEESKLNDGVGQSCQWCAYARRIAMFKLCQKYNATKIAFGHHMDDIVVTTMMNMIEGRKLKIMPPVNKMSKGDITFIRPMAYIREKDLVNFVKQKEIPYSSCNCPVGENTMRNKIKYNIIWENEKNFPKYTENMFWALIKDFREKYEKDGYSM
ncbi:MAG: tRNA 2-thiocytidine biosynthesis TtcA family protein [Candidatus Gracilibacteria bacterium]|nr:tRNA 2-thiocytidine biosynthesis TtcA family protein [Candidatus Gracilibacteria bacterium]